MPQTITAKLGTYGTVRRNGQRVYKVALCEQCYFEQIGWKYTGHGQSYAYMLAPEGHKGKHAYIELVVPTDEEIVALAERLHAAGEPYRGFDTGWSVKYIPARRRQGIRGMTMATNEGVKTNQEPYDTTTPAEFSIGQSLVWAVAAVWDQPDDDIRWYWHDAT